MTDKDQWGYARRVDQPERVIPVPPQAQPRNELPRAVDAAVKNPTAAAVAFFQIQYLKMCDNGRLVSQNSLDVSASGGGGSDVLSAADWYSRIGRFCRKSVFTHNAGAMGFNEERIALDQSLFALLSPSGVGVAMILKFEDVIALDLTFTSSGTAAFQFGLRSGVSAPATLAPDNAFVGFYCSMAVSGTYGPWIAGVWADAGGAGNTKTTAITCEHPHRLSFEINSQTGTVTFSIDGVVVHTVTGYASVQSQTNDDAGLSWIHCCGGSGVHSASSTAGYWIDNQAIIGVRVLDEAA